MILLKNKLLVLLLVLTLIGCEKGLNEFLSDKYERPQVPTFTISMNVHAKILVKFYQHLKPGVNGSAKTVANYLEVVNVGDDEIMNLKMILKIYEGDSIHSFDNMLIHRYIQLSEPIHPGEKDSIFIDSFFENVLSPDDLSLRIIEYNDSKIYSSGLYEGTFKTFKDSEVISGGMVYGDISYTGDVDLCLTGNENLAFLKGVSFPDDSLFICQALRLHGTEFDRVSCKLKVENNLLTTSLLFSDSDPYDSLVLNLNQK